MFEFLQYRVADAMTPIPITTGPDTRLRDLERLFETHDFNGIPIVDEEQHLLGMVTKFDLLKAFTLNPSVMVPPYEAIMEQTAESVMTHNPVSIAPELPLSRLVEKMVEMRTKSFPVVHEDRIVGIIAREDVLKALRRATSHQPPPRDPPP